MFTNALLEVPSTSMKAIGKRKLQEKALEYEAENMKITNLEEANQYFH